MRSSLRRRASLGTAFAALGAGLTALSAHPAAAQTTVYSNTTTFSGSGYAPGGATSAAGSTLIDADDLNLLSGSAGLSVSGFTFSVANFNTVAVAAAPTVYFYSSAATGGPGTLLYAVRFNPLSPGASSVGTYNYNPTGGNLFTLPTGTLWAGMSFSNGTTGTATVDQLNNFGQGIYSPPTVGSSSDAFFESDAPATATSNPVGAVYKSPFGGAPVGNFGWSIRTSASPAVPEASTTVSLGLLLALGMGGLIVASKRKKVGVQA